MYVNESYGHIVVLVIGLAIAALMLWAIIETIRSQAMTVAGKIFWTLLIVLVPVIGLAVWVLTWFTGGRQAARNARPTT